MRVLSTAALAGALLLSTGCTKSPGDGGDQPVGSKEDAYGANGVKADCFGCSEEDAKSALEQTGLAKRFLRSGDFWTVAFKFDHHRAIEHASLDLIDGEGGKVVGGDVYLFDYRVKATERRVVGDYKRGVATIEIFQATTPNSFRGLVEESAIDANEHRLELEMDDLLRAVGKKYFNTEYPNGLYVGIEPGDGVRPVADAFPTAVPNITAGETELRTLPELPEDLAAVGAKAASLGQIPEDWDSREYRFFSFDSGEQTYWAEGELWPFYVRSERGHALVIDTTGIAE